jgi:hypothetical protein
MIVLSKLGGHRRTGDGLPHKKAFNEFLSCSWEAADKTGWFFVRSEIGGSIANQDNARDNQEQTAIIQSAVFETTPGDYYEIVHIVGIAACRRPVKCLR